MGSFDERKRSPRVFKKPARIDTNRPQYTQGLPDQYAPKVRSVPVRRRVSDDTVTKAFETRTRVAPRPRPDLPRKPIKAPVQRVEKRTPAVKAVDDNVKIKSVKEKDEEAVTAKQLKTDDYYELGSVMSRALDAELRTIMIKVWQELPDAPNNDASRLVADKFRNRAGDDLLNTIGLNVTKRLLDIHNTLFVKLHFDRKPDSAKLRSFLNEYNCASLRRTTQLDYTFAARVRSIADFDRLCDIGVAKCGIAKVTITPLYKFNQCPPKLRTIYNPSSKTSREHDEKEDEQNEEKGTDTNADGTDEASKRNDNSSADVTATEKETKIEAKEVIAQNNTTPVETKKEGNQTAAKTTENQTATAKQNVPNETNATVKQVESKVVTNKQNEKLPTNTTPCKVSPQVATQNATKVIATKEIENKLQETKATPNKEPSKVTKQNADSKNETTKVIANENKVQETKTPCKEPPKVVTKLNSDSTKDDTKIITDKQNANKVQVTKSTPSKVPAKAATITPVNKKEIPDEAKAIKTNLTPVKEVQQAKVNETKVTPNKVTPTKPEQKSTTNATVTKPTTTPKTNAVKATPAKTQTKTAPKVPAKLQQNAKVQKQKITPRRQNVKRNTNSRVTRSRPKKAIDELSDNDELDDADILALMSQSIVLDECGPDE